MSKQLVVAAEAGDLDKVAALLAAGADVNWTGKSGAGRTALSEAALNGHAEAVGLLIASGADLNWRDRAMGLTPLGWACHSGHLEAARILIEAGADLDLPTPEFLLSPLMCAAISGRESIVRLLLDAGANIHALTADGRNALVCAEKNGHGAIAALLRERGAVLPPPVIEPPIIETCLPWPDVGEDLSKVDYARPESVLRAFILSMYRWEAEAAKHVPNLDWSKAKADYDKAFAPYCTAKKRVYSSSHSISASPDYEPQENLTGVIVNSRRAELTTIQRKERLGRYERLYVMLKKGDRWLIDSKKDRCVGLKEWKNTIL
jgi:hypothetical protein